MHRLTHFALRRPRVTLAMLLLVTAALGSGLPRVRVEFGYRVLVGEDHPAIRQLDVFIDRFAGGLPIYVVWECGPGFPCDDVFAESSLLMSEHLGRHFSSLPGVRRVYSPSTASLLVPNEYGFTVTRLVEGGEVSPGIDDLAQRALTDPFWVGRLVSRDRRVAAIILQPTGSWSEETVRLFEQVERALAPFEQQGFRFYLVGDAPSVVTAGRDLANSMARLVPITVAVVALVLLSLSRSWRDSAVALASVGLALVWTFGALGWLGWPRDAISEVLAPLVLIVGVCDAIHLLTIYRRDLGRTDARAPFEARTAALLSASRDVGPPCLLTTLTTAAAFLSFVTSALDTFVRFGLISAFAVVSCLLVTFTLLPVLARALCRESAASGRALRSWSLALQAVVRASQRRSGAIVAAAVVLLVICGAGWTRLRVDNYWLEALGERSQAVRWVRFVEDHLRPADGVEMVLGLPEDARLEDPATIRTIMALSRRIEKIEGLESPRSVVDLLSRLNRLLHDDVAAYERPGDSLQANAELLELIALDDAGFLQQWVSLDRSMVRLSIGATDQSYADQKNAMERLKSIVVQVLPREWDVGFSGEVVLSMAWVTDIQGTQLRSFPTAFALVFVLVAAFLRSLRLAAAAMIPTLLPVVVTLGTMGWLGMSLDIGRSMIAAILIGIAVDDSIHLLHEYRRGRAARLTAAEAIERAVLHVGRAVVTTSAALSLGFLTLMASAWQTIASFGFFVALAILGALAAALFLLPAVIFAVAGRAGADR